MKRNTHKWEEWHLIRQHTTVRYNIDKGWRCAECGDKGDLTTRDDRLIKSWSEIRTAAREANDAIERAYGIRVTMRLAVFGLTNYLYQGVRQRISRLT